jgi:hypothetical protein
MVSPLLGPESCERSALTTISIGALPPSGTNSDMTSESYDGVGRTVNQIHQRYSQNTIQQQVPLAV